jgi:hypothetical protein
MPDVIRFGATYVAQHPECAEIVEHIVVEANARRWKTQGACLTHVTSRLQQEGLTVASIAMLRNRRHRERQRWATFTRGGGWTA